MKILIADNDIDRRFKIKILLRKYEVEFREARNSFETLKFIEGFKPDLIIIDYLIPNNHAFPVLKRIRSQGINTPALIFVKKELEFKNVDIKNVYFFSFPIEEGKFVQMIERITGKKFVEKKEEEGTVKLERKERLKILIADDEEEIRILLKTLLGPENEYEEAENGEELIEKAKKFLPDLIITDIIMPKLSGWKAIKELRKIQDLKNVPVIFSSGLVKDKELYETLKPEGPSAFILKPFTKKQIEEVLNKFFIRRNG